MARFLALVIPLVGAVTQAVVNVAVADLRAKPQDPVVPIKYWTDPDQLTQLLYLENVVIRQVSGDWSYIEAFRQPMLYNDTWGGYLGWVRSKALTTVKDFPEYSLAAIERWVDVFQRPCTLLGCTNEDVIMTASFGTWFGSKGSCTKGWQPVTAVNASAGGLTTGYVRCTSVAAFSTSEDQVRSLMPSRIGEVLGFPYLWGGRSALSLPLLEKGVQLTGLDCSGLVSMFYLSNGWLLPRDASKQAVIAINSTSTQLRVGDLFFYGIPNSTTAHVGHVMMLYELQPEPLIVESASNSTRILTVVEKYGAKLEDLQWGVPLKGGMNPGSILTWGQLHF